MLVQAPSPESFRSLLRIATSSIAEPPWFATPVDAHEDEESFTVVFHVPRDRRGEVSVACSDRSVTISGHRPGARRRLTRVCALPCAISSSGFETSRSGDLLKVRILKKRAANDNVQKSSSPAEGGGG